MWWWVLELVHRKQPLIVSGNWADKSRENETMQMKNTEMAQRCWIYRCCTCWSQHLMDCCYKNVDYNLSPPYSFIYAWIQLIFHVAAFPMSEFSDEVLNCASCFRGLTEQRWSLRDVFSGPESQLGISPLWLDQMVLPDVSLSFPQLLFCHLFT